MERRNKKQDLKQGTADCHSLGQKGRMGTDIHRGPEKKLGWGRLLARSQEWPEDGAIQEGKDFRNRGFQALS